jgi:hypothetical protein
MTVEIGANEVTAVYLPIRVTRLWQPRVQVTAHGVEQMSDAVLREVEVLPDGQPHTRWSTACWPRSKSFAVQLPADAVPGAGRVARCASIPCVVSQVLDRVGGAAADALRLLRTDQQRHLSECVGARLSCAAQRPGRTRASSCRPKPDQPRLPAAAHLRGARRAGRLQPLWRPARRCPRSPPMGCKNSPT